MCTEAELVQCKDYVVLRRGPHAILHQLNKKPRVQFLGASIDLRNVIGKPYSSTYRMEMVQKNSYLLQPCGVDDACHDLAAVDCSESGADNRDIQDDNNAQALSKDEIVGMKNSGLSSQDIVQELVNHSKTFSRKTEFAQEKWLRRKSKKYSDYVTVLKPTVRLLAEVLMSSPSAPNDCKLLSLRADTLSQIVTAVSFQPQGTYIVYENGCEGLVMATLTNLIGPQGRLVNVVTPNYAFHKRKALAAMKFSEAKQKSVINVSASAFFKYSRDDNLQSVDGSADGGDRALSVGASEHEPESCVLPAVTENCDNGSDVNPSVHTWADEDRPPAENGAVQIESCEDEAKGKAESDDGRRKRKADGESPAGSECKKKTTYQEVENAEVRRLMRCKADGLIVVCRESPCHFVKEMLQFVAPSRSFVVFHQMQQPLIELCDNLKRCSDVIHTNLVDNWLRSYQMLPDRTHPEITMLGTGGYLLSGIVVTDNSE